MIRKFGVLNEEDKQKRESIRERRNGPINAGVKNVYSAQVS